MTTRYRRRIMQAGVPMRLRKIAAAILVGYVAACCLLLAATLLQ